MIGHMAKVFTTLKAIFSRRSWKDPRIRVVVPHQSKMISVARKQARKQNLALMVDHHQIKIVQIVMEKKALLMEIIEEVVTKIEVQSRNDKEF